MLRMLRITSRCFAVLALMAAVLIVFAFQTENKTIKAFLEQVEARQFTGTTQTPDHQSALLACATEFANRINPPVIIEPPKQQDPPDKGDRTRTDPGSDKGKQHEGTTITMAPKYQLVGTVTCEGSPDRSLALIKTRNDRFEWFTKGQTIGHHRIMEINDGSMMIKNGTEQQMLTVPAKPDLAALLMKG